MCRNPDGSYIIPYAGDEFVIPTDAVSLHIIHSTAYHVDEEELVFLIVSAYEDLDRLWLHFRRSMYAIPDRENITEAQYKAAMNYLVACAVAKGELEAMVDLVRRMEQEAW